MQNIGLFLTPVTVGNIIAREKDPVAAEYFFILLAVAALMVSIVFSRASDTNPALGLDRKAG